MKSKQKIRKLNKIKNLSDKVVYTKTTYYNNIFFC